MEKTSAFYNFPLKNYTKYVGYKWWKNITIRNNIKTRNDIKDKLKHRRNCYVDRKCCTNRDEQTFII